MEAVELKYNTYPAYKDSGVTWLGKIPEHWDAIKIKYLFRDISIKNRPEETLLSVTQDKGVVPRDWVENRMVMPSGSLESFKYIEKGDFSISLRSFEGGLEYCHQNGIISPAYTVLRKREDLVADYYKYLFKSKSFISEMQTSIVGIREGKNISYPILSYSLIPIPSIPEQTAIANFLDKKTAKIDKVIAQKEKLIELLKERKQILIQNAVTGKINCLNYDSNDDHENYDFEKEKHNFSKNHSLSQNQNNHSSRPMKDSGVEWIGEIPVGWEVKKLKYVLKLSNDKELSKDSSMIYVGMENIESNTGRFIHTTSEVEGLANRFKEKDILFGKLRPYLAKVYLAEFDGLCSTEFLVYRCKSPFYFQKLMLSKAFVSMVDSSTYGAKMPRASSEWIGNRLITVPPQKEQKQIVSYIETQSTKIDKAIVLQQTQIEKLKEYKATLIDSAVTGKIKVS